MDRKKLIEEGKFILRDIDQAQDYLASASTWGVADMIFGGGLTSMVKQSKIRKGQALIREMEKKLTSFKLNLEGQELAANQIGDLEAFVDIFFDNIFVDFFIQSKLAKNRQNLASLKANIQSIIKNLEER